jgi:hypothetical protein
MGIHHDYKNRRGEKKLRKLHKKEMRRKKRPVSVEQSTEDSYVAKLDEIITLDLLTNPNKTK